MQQVLLWAIRHAAVASRGKLWLIGAGEVYP